jgi:hypothetical protein
LLFVGVYLTSVNSCISVDAAVDADVLKKQAEEAEERRRAAQRAQGTAVTKESFAAWAERFQAELEQLEVAEERPSKGDKIGVHRQTGKEWFLEKSKNEGAEGEDDLEQELASLNMEDEEGQEDDSEGSFIDEDEDDDGEDEDEDFLDEYLAHAEEGDAADTP